MSYLTIGAGPRGDESLGDLGCERLVIEFLLSINLTFSHCRCWYNSDHFDRQFVPRLIGGEYD
jgi:hypothetical protein